MNPLLFLFFAFFWYFGDIMTTYIGFSKGFSEINPLFINNTFLEMVLIKTFVLGIIFIFIQSLDKINIKIAKYCKLFILFTIFVVGATVTTYNITIIRGITL